MQAKVSTLVIAFVFLIRTAGHAQVASTSDSAITRLRAMVLRSNPELVALRASSEAAELRMRAVGYSGPAVLTAEIEEIPNGIDVSKAGSVRVDVTRDLTSRALKEGRRAVAGYDVEQRSLALQMLERSLSMRVAQHLERVASYAAISRRLASEDSLLVGIDESVRNRFATGDARYIDVLRLRTERLRVRSELAALATDASVARRTLLALAGDSISAGLDALALIQTVVSRASLPEVPTSPAGLSTLDSLVETSGRVRTLQLQLQRSQRQAGLVLAEQRPSFTLGVGVQRFGSERGFEVGPAITAGMTLPFSVAGRTRALTTAATADIRATTALLRAKRLEVRTELASALDRFESARTRASFYDTALLTGARQERESALAAFRAGSVTLVELLDFERALARAEIDYLRSRIAAQDALASLMDAWTRLGGEPSNAYATDEQEPSR